MSFEEWFAENVGDEYVLRSRRLMIEKAWDHQQNKVDELEKKLAEAMDLVERLYSICPHIPSTVYYDYMGLKESLEKKEGE